MSRRYHSKSRLGCAQCKRRHIKCDEGRPSCANCSTSRLDCVYSTVLTTAKSPAASSTPIAYSPAGQMDLDPGSPNSSRTVSRSPNPLNGVSSPQPPPSGPSLSPTQNVHQPVNIHHMELLSHFVLETSLMLGPSHSSATRLSLAITLSTPYLVNQVLALSALHLSYLHPDQAKTYAEEAAVFQANSLSSLVSNTVEINKENCVPMLLFSALLGIYTLADAVITSDGNNFNFLDKYISYLNVHRGTHAVVAPFWDYLRQTELSPFLNTAAHLDQPSKSQDELEEVCNKLQVLLDAADMGEASLKACRDAVHHLRWVLGSISHAQASNQQATADTIYSWPILLSATFTKLLSKRRPEALIILAHYAVVLHERREIWVVGDSGRWLINAITVHLGSYWKDWLMWPNNALLHVTAPGGTVFLGAGAQ